jgi:hypothetical protein
LALGVPDPELHGAEAWREFVLSLRRALFESKRGLPLLAALILSEQEHPELLAIWRDRVVAPRIEMIQALTGLPADRARLIGQLAMGGSHRGVSQLGRGVIRRSSQAGR